VTLCQWDVAKVFCEVAFEKNSADCNICVMLIVVQRQAEQQSLVVPNRVDISLLSFGHGNSSSFAVWKPNLLGFGGKTASF
jgi:hypothetical protein